MSWFLTLLSWLFIFHCSLAQQPFEPVKSGMHWGFVKKNGKLAIPFEYDTVTAFDERLAITGKRVGNEVRFGVINHKNSVILPFQWRKIARHGRYYLVEDSLGKRGVFGISGKQMTGIDYKKIDINKTDLILHSFPSWIIFRQEEILDSLAADSLALTSEGVVCAFRNGTAFEELLLPVLERKKASFEIPSVVETSEQIYPELSDSIKALYDTVGLASEGFYTVVHDQLAGFIDSSGKIRISLRYEEVHPFSEGLAAVKLVGKWGVIDTYEKIVIQPDFEEIGRFHNGVAWVKRQGKYNFIDTLGNLQNFSWYDTISELSSGNWLLISKSQKGLAGESGQEQIIPKYDYLKDYGNGLVKVEKLKLRGILDYEQNILIPVKFEEVVVVGQNVCFAKVLQRKKEEKIVIDITQDARKKEE